MKTKHASRVGAKAPQRIAVAFRNSAAPETQIPWQGFYQGICFGAWQAP
jgi:hypothetical protein